jgi:septation ring formation regulator EzrA
MIDIAKLNRIEEQHAELADASRALFERYKRRTASAKEKHGLAVRLADAVFQNLPLTGLADYTNEQLQAVRIDILTLTSARDDQRVAVQLLADFNGRQKALNESAALLHNLKQYANVRDE